uniref:MAX dimerization protein 4 n=1 Tax=Astatotilapia calliptera TaxID=8154 RepID=A0AAX7U6E2_ASTCA
MTNHRSSEPLNPLKMSHGQAQSQSETKRAKERQATIAQHSLARAGHVKRKKEKSVCASHAHTDFCVCMRFCGGSFSLSAGGCVLTHFCVCLCACRRAKLRLYLEQLKKLVPLGPDSTRHTTLSLLKRAKMHIKKLEEQDRKALNVKEQLQREHRYLKRRLEQLSVSGSVERIRTDSMGSTISTDSEQEVDIEGMEFTPVEADSVDSISDGEEEDQYSLQSSSSDNSYTGTHSHRLQPHHC